MNFYESQSPQLSNGNDKDIPKNWRKKHIATYTIYSANKIAPKRTKPEICFYIRFTLSSTTSPNHFGKTVNPAFPRPSFISMEKLNGYNVPKKGSPMKAIGRKVSHKLNIKMEKIFPFNKNVFCK